MRASKNGIEIGKAELVALLTFAGTKDNTDHVYFGIRERRAKLVASATNGSRALEITTESDSADHVIGEWRVNRAFLEACSRVMESEGLCILLVTSSGLRKARIMDVESLAERATVSWHEEAASTQVTMENLATIITQAQLLAGHRGTWFALQGRYLGDMLVVSKACNKAPITLYPPSSHLDPVYFEATSDGAQWRGVMMPVRIEQPGGREEEDDDDALNSFGVNEAVQNFKDTLTEHGATVTFEQRSGEEPLATQKKPKAAKPKKGSKK